MVTTTTPQTTPPEIKEVPEYINVESEVYEPSAAVRIQRVLYRLDSGEQLASGYLKHRDNFCVLGLFADESGMGDWTGRVKGSPGATGYLVDSGDVKPKHRLISKLSGPMADYYGLNSASGQFYIKALPESLQNRLFDLLGQNIRTHNNKCALSIINDELLERGYGTEVVNDILAQIIRSGVVFKS